MLLHLFYRLLEKDPFHLKSTLVHLAAAMELGQSNELYLMACNLVKDYPQKWGWFYYLTTSFTFSMKILHVYLLILDTHKIVISCICIMNEMFFSSSRLTEVQKLVNWAKLSLWIVLYFLWNGDWCRWSRIQMIDSRLSFAFSALRCSFSLAHLVEHSIGRFLLSGLYHGSLLVAITTVSRSMINHAVISGIP